MRMLRQEQDAEDVTQQTFLSALQNLDGFRGEASFTTASACVYFNQLINHVLKE